MNDIPFFLKGKLENQYGIECTKKIINGYKISRKTTFRINILKTTKEYVLEELKKHKFKVKEVPWYENAFILENKNELDIMELELYKDGFIYLQSLSSMLPVLFLNPKENDHILDMAASPGSKTTQIAMVLKNKGCITACERNKVRIERLKYNLEKQGVTCCTTMLIDARDLDDFFSFDKILLDAPCSGSGTLSNNLKENQFFNENLIEKSKKTQLALLRKALKLLKPNQEMIYSTCSILEEENELILETVKKEFNISIEPISLNDENICFLPTKIEGVICVCPNEYYEGFFIAKIRKNK